MHKKRTSFIIQDGSEHNGTKAEMIMSISNSELIDATFREWPSHQCSDPSAALTVLEILANNHIIYGSSPIGPQQVLERLKPALEVLEICQTLPVS